MAVMFFILNDISVKAICTGKKSIQSFNVVLKFRMKKWLLDLFYRPIHNEGAWFLIHAWRILL